ncbi:uncharacterized protein [Argopecten irradians]|uniref:uncharacterized protein n=1 Tax=Argopecten irradians TaxID=31199 RepID=UPI0037140AC7
MVRDRIAFGVKNPKVREKLINIGSDLTLAKALDTARNYELSHAQARDMSKIDLEEVNMVAKSKFKKKSAVSVKPKKTITDNDDECGRCRYSKKHKVCPAIGQTCKKCKLNDHFAKKCGSKKKKINMINVQKSEDSSEDELYVGSIKRDHTEVTEWTQTINVEDGEINFQLDTGAACNVLSYQNVKDLNKLSDLKSTSVPLRSYSGHKMIPKGVVTLDCKYKGTQYNTVFQVVDSTNIKPILGAKACEKMGLVARMYRIEQTYKNIPDDIVKDYGSLFKGIGCMPGVHTIKTDPGVKPVIHPPRKIPLALKAKVKAELDLFCNLICLKNEH